MVQSRQGITTSGRERQNSLLLRREMMPEYYSKEQLGERVMYREKVASLRYDRLPKGDVVAVLQETNQLLYEILIKGLLDYQPLDLENAEFLENWTEKITLKLIDEFLSK